MRRSQAQVYLVYATRPGRDAEPLIAVVTDEVEAVAIERELPGARVRWETLPVDELGDAVHLVLQIAGDAETGDPIGIAAYSSLGNAERAAAEVAASGAQVRVLSVRPGWRADPTNGDEPA